MVSTRTAEPGVLAVFLTDVLDRIDSPCTDFLV